MFAVLVSGRLVQTNYQEISSNKCVFDLDNATSIHNLAVFMTGSQPLPSGTGAVIFLGWPPFDNWNCLGYISNDKPSALFKVNQVQHSQAFTTAGFGTPTMVGENIVAQIGIEILPISEVLHQFGTREQQSERSVTNNVSFCQKMLTSFYNYSASYQIELQPNHMRPPELFFPANILEKWYSKFENRLKKDPDFWKSL
eukprot:TRINITY_DN5169_c0_g1_i1.p1 TRINITY_DN5169_c0_g1~~TRINITY_DN5169_c0_g1_i1.p1  ORF type:complete len:198 (+),score=17.84 TRINITY_DN5169_c0_g1_i1:121-714(+)